jgi:hypothetical protein
MGIADANTNFQPTQNPDCKNTVNPYKQPLNQATLSSPSNPIQHSPVTTKQGTQTPQRQPQISLSLISLTTSIRHAPQLRLRFTKR